MKPWLIYSRVSTDDQAQAGVSMDAQLTACRAFAVAKGWTVSEEISDPGESGASFKRPGIQKVLAAIKAGKVAGVIAWRLDRLTRNIRDLLDLLAMAGDKAGIVSVTESLDTTTPMGRFTTHLLGIIAQWERETIGARTTSAMVHIRAKGFYTGGRKPPAGCVVVPEGERRRLVAGPDAPQVRPIWAQVVAGRSLRQVADYLREAGIPGAWTPAAARNLLLSPLVVGVLVDQADQLRVRHLLNERVTPMRPGNKTQPRPIEDPSPLRGLVRCPTCEAAMVQVYARGHGGTYRYFRCTAKVKRLCRQKDVRCETVEDAAFKAIAEACRPGGPYQATLRDELAMARAQSKENQEKRAKVQAERDQVAARIGAMALQSSIGAAAWAEAMKALGAELDRLDGILAGLLGTCSAAEVDAGSFALVLDEIAKHTHDLAKQSREEQTATCRALIQSIRIEPDAVHIDMYAQKKNNLGSDGPQGSKNSQLWLPGQGVHLTPTRCSSGSAGGPESSSRNCCNPLRSSRLQNLTLADLIA